MKSQALERQLLSMGAPPGSVPVAASSDDIAGHDRAREALDGLVASYLYDLCNQVGIMIFDAADEKFLHVRSWNERAIHASLHYDPRSKPNCLVFYGPPGYGKTTLAVLAAKSAVMKTKRCKVHFERASAMLRRLRSLFPSEQMHEIKMLCSRDIVIIDDLGVSSVEKAVVEELLLEIIDWRYARGKALIVTTNVPIGQWTEYFGGRIASRLKDRRWASAFGLFPNQVKE